MWDPQANQQRIEFNEYNAKVYEFAILKTFIPEELFVKVLEATKQWNPNRCMAVQWHLKPPNINHGTDPQMTVVFHFYLDLSGTSGRGII